MSEMFEAVQDAKEKAQSWYEAATDIWESGELESILIGIGTGIGVLYLLGKLAEHWGRRSARAPRSGSARVDLVDPDSNCELIPGTQLKDSDDEPDARRLIAELSRGQHYLQQSIAKMAGAMSSGKSDVEGLTLPRKKEEAGCQ